MVIKFLMIMVYVFSATVGLVLVKKFFNANTADLWFSYGATNKYQLYLGGFLYCLSFLFWIYLVSQFRLSVILPIAVGLIYISSLVLAVVFLGETLSVKHLIGSTLILIGVYLLFQEV